MPSYHRGHYIPLSRRNTSGYRNYRYGRRLRITKVLTRKRSTYHGPTQEMKFFDSIQTDSVVATTGVVTGSVNLVPQSVTEEGRIGRKIRIKSIMMHWFFSLPAEANQPDVGNGDTLRIIVFIDHQANGANATVTDLLETANIESFRNLANSKRFTILMDKKRDINRTVAATDGTNTSTSPLVSKHMQFYSRKMDLPIEFDSTSGAITEIRSNNVAMLYISNLGEVGINTEQTRIRYFG